MTFKRAGFLTKLVVLALIIYMAIALLDLRGKILGVQAERDGLNRQVASQQQKNQELAEAIANSDDLEMLERAAREKGYVYKGETLFIDVAN